MVKILQGLSKAIRNFLLNFPNLLGNYFMARALSSKDTGKVKCTITLTKGRFRTKIRDQAISKKFISKGWQSQPPVFDEANDPAAKMDFLKERIGIEVGFGHSSFIGIDLLKFQVASYSSLDKIDVGVYVVTTHNFQIKIMKEYKQNWEGSLSFEKVVRYLPHFKSAIQLPIYVLGIDV